MKNSVHAMHMLISYDIGSNSKRLKIANELLNYGLQRVQKSVFEGEIKKAELKKLKAILLKYISKHDSIRYYVLCKECQVKIQVSGQDQLQPRKNQTQFF